MFAPKYLFSYKIIKAFIVCNCETEYEIKGRVQDIRGKGLHAKGEQSTPEEEGRRKERKKTTIFLLTITQRKD